MLAREFSEQGPKQRLESRSQSSDNGGDGEDSLAIDATGSHVLQYASWLSPRMSRVRFSVQTWNGGEVSCGKQEEGGVVEETRPSLEESRQKYICGKREGGAAGKGARGRGLVSGRRFGWRPWTATHSSSALQPQAAFKPRSRFLQFLVTNNRAVG